MKYVIALFVLIALPLVSAEYVPGQDLELQIYDCVVAVNNSAGISQAACTDEVTVACQVTDYTTSNTGVNEVLAYTNQGDKEMTCYQDQAGTIPCDNTDKNNGTWIYRTTGEDISSESSLQVYGVVATTAEGFTCDLYGASGYALDSSCDGDTCCVAEYDPLQYTILGTCEEICEYSETREESSDGSITVIRTPNQFCESQAPIINTIGAGECNPTIYQVNNACQVTNDPTRQDTSQDPFSGTREVEYYVEDLACCNEFPELCQPPPDEGEVVNCTLDFWSGYGQDQFNGQHNFDAVGYTSSFYKTDFNVTEPVRGLYDESEQISGRTIKPVVGDFLSAGDGISEIVYFLDNGQYRISTQGDYEFDVLTLKDQVGNDMNDVRWLSQPGLIGYNHKFVSQNSREVGWWLGQRQGGLCTGSDVECQLCNEDPTSVQNCCYGVFNDSSALSETAESMCVADSAIFSINGEVSDPIFEGETYEFAGNITLKLNNVISATNFVDSFEIPAVGTGSLIGVSEGTSTTYTTLDDVDLEVIPTKVSGPNDPACLANFACGFTSNTVFEEQYGIGALINNGTNMLFVNLVEISNNRLSVLNSLDLTGEDVVDVSSGVNCIEDMCYFTAYRDILGELVEEMWWVEMDAASAAGFNNYGKVNLRGSVSESCYGTPDECSTFTDEQTCGAQSCNWAEGEESVSCAAIDQSSFTDKLYCGALGIITNVFNADDNFCTSTGICENKVVSNSCTGYVTCEMKTEAACVAGGCTYGAGNVSDATVGYTNSKVRNPTPVQTDIGQRVSEKVVFPAYASFATAPYLSLCDTDGSDCSIADVAGKYDVPPYYTITNVVSDTIFGNSGPQMYFATYDLPKLYVNFNLTEIGPSDPNPPSGWDGMAEPQAVFAQENSAYALDSLCVLHRFDRNESGLFRNTSGFYGACLGNNSAGFSAGMDMYENTMYAATNYDPTGGNLHLNWRESDGTTGNIFGDSEEWPVDSTTLVKDVIAENGYLYVLQTRSLSVFRINNVTPEFINEFDLERTGYAEVYNDADIANNRMYVAGTRGLSVLNIQNKNNIFRIGRFDETRLDAVEVQGDYAYAVDDQTNKQLYVLDISDVNSISVANTLAVSGDALQIDFPYLFVQDNKQSYIYDIRTAADPEFLDQTEWAGGCVGCKQYASNSYLYYADGSYVSSNGNMHYSSYENYYGTVGGESSVNVHKAGLSLGSNFDEFAQSQFVKQGVSLQGQPIAVMDPVLATCAENQLGVLIGIPLEGGQTQYSCYVNSITSMDEAYTILIDEAEPKSFATADFDQDGVDEIVTPSGMYRNDGTPLTSTGLKSSGFETVVVDWNADLLADLMYVTPGRSVNYISNPGVAVNIDPNAEPSAASCRALAYEDVGGTMRVVAVPYGMTLQNLNATDFEGTFTDGSTGYGISNGEPKVILTPSQFGEKTVNIQILTLNGTQTQELNVQCPVTIPEFDAGDSGEGCSGSNCPDPEEDREIKPEIDNCEFEGVNSIGQTQWQGSGAYSEFTTYSMILDGSASTEPIEYELSSTSTTFFFDIRFKASAGAVTSFYVKGQSPQTNAEIIVAELLVDNGRVFYRTAEGYTRFVEGILAGDWYNVQFVLDMESRAYNVNIGGINASDAQNSSIAFTNQQVSQITRVGIDPQEGDIEIDSACVDGSDEYFDSRTISEIRQEAAELYLEQCSEPENSGWERNFDENPAGDVANYQIVQQYCTLLGKEYCSVADLQRAIAINRDCYYEAHNYCQAVTFVQSAGFEDDSSVQEYQVTPSLSGEVACTTVLGASVTFTSIITPILSNIWLLITDNFIITLLLVVFIILVGGTVAMRRNK